MHELSIAISILDIAKEEALARGASRVAAVHLQVGPLAGVMPEALVWAYELASEGSPLQGSRLVLEKTALVVKCPTCGGPRPAISPQEMCCATCGAACAELVSGRELEITAMEIVE